MLKWKPCLLILMSVILITGCWDKVEIDKRAFVVAMAIDKFEAPKEKEKQEKGKPQKPSDTARNRYTITYAFPNTATLAGKGEGGEPKFVYAATGLDIFNIERSIRMRLAPSLAFGHTKVIVVGDDLAKDEKLMRETLDIVERIPQVGRKLNFLVTSGKAQDILKTSPTVDPQIGIFIRDLMDQSKRITARIPDADLGYILRSLHESKVAIAPRVLSTEDGVIVAGAAVLKDYKRVGWLGEIETKALMFMMDKLNSTEVTVKIDEILIPCEITDSETKMKVFEEEGTIYTRFEITGEGDVNQHLFGVINQPLDNEYLQSIEKELNTKIKQFITSTHKKIQKDFGTDLVQAGEYLRKHEPKLWEKVREDWEEIYPETEVQVSVDIKIRRVGVTQ
ncbi:Ger(x)C family spore germination protein [Clostridiaceae bacterium 35-E11]